MLRRRSLIPFLPPASAAAVTVMICPEFNFGPAPQAGSRQGWQAARRRRDVAVGGLLSVRSLAASDSESLALPRARAPGRPSAGAGRPGGRRAGAAAAAAGPGLGRASSESPGTEQPERPGCRQCHGLAAAGGLGPRPAAARVRARRGRILSHAVT